MFYMTIPSIFLFFDGLVCILASVFAHKIGLDPTLTWGRLRFFILLLGIFLVFISLYSTLLARQKHNFNIFLKSEKTNIVFSLAHIWGIIFLIYIWLVTYGNFTTWDRTTHYYTQLANAFSKGQLYVDLKPGTALAEAPDPYHPTDRPAFDDEVWDMSLYKGKLFLYWGPVPALLITPIQMIFEKKITDNYLTFFFFSGLLIFNSLTVIRLRKILFPALPVRVMLISIILIGLICPILWSLSTPNVYEAAIGAGQFFLLGGLYFIISSIENKKGIRKRNLFLAGVCWACAVGSRAINVFSVTFLLVLVTFWMAKKAPKPFSIAAYFQTISALYIPIIIGAILIGAYNWGRFDSPFEFGLRYQITIFNLNKDMGLVFHPEYFRLNLYTYLFTPFQIIPQFPFIQPIIVSNMFLDQGIITPHLYGAGRVTGLLFCAPFLFLSLAYVFLKNTGPKIRGFIKEPQPYSFVILLFAGSFSINFSYVLFYFFGQTRFLVDIISQLTLLSILGYWQIFLLESKRRLVHSRLIIHSINFLIAFTICTGFLLSLTGEANRMRALNPLFFDKINYLLSNIK